MSERIKLGLTRNRLFEFDNCVCFTGKLREELDFSECEKSLKLLFLKEPLLSCSVELSEEGDAFLVTDSVEPKLEMLEGDENVLVEQKKRVGLNFNEKLFSFAVINKNTFAIFAHTLVADVRALSYLAMEFMSFYKKEKVSAEPSQIMVFSESSQLLSNVFSVVIDRVASGLEVGWQKKVHHFSFADYQKAREKYFAEKSQTETLSAKLDGDMLNTLKEFSRAEKTDVSSLVAYAFYEALTEELAGKRKYKKLNVQANERPFFEDFQNMKTGAFNGVVTVVLKKNKNTPQNPEGRAAAFHKEIYKKITTAFSVFYNEVLFMRLSGSFCDSQYMYCAGLLKHKYSKRLALTYGCANLVAGEFSSMNFNQESWKKLSVFDEISVSEPLKMRSSSLVTFTEQALYGGISFEYKINEIPKIKGEKIFEHALEILKNLI